MKILKIAFRNLLKNKVVSPINWIGLTLGVVISLLLFSYVQQEKDTDKFIKNYENIYSLHTKKLYTLSKPLIDFVETNLSGVEMTYFSSNWAGQVFLSDGNNRYKIQNLLDADSSFFKVFDFESLWGNPKKGLNASNKIVLTESLSKKIFGNENPVGKTLNYNTSYLSNQDLEVTAVIKDLPENTAWQFDAVLPIQTNNKIGWYEKNTNLWYAHNFAVFFKDIANRNPENIKNQLDAIAQIPELKENIEDELSFEIKKYADNYLQAEFPENLKHGDAKTLSIIQLIALLIIFMAIINYINLVSAQRQKRNKSVAIMKMLGSQNWGVVQLFMAEAIIMIFVVLITLVFVAPLAINLFNQLMNTHYTVDLLFSPFSLGILAGILAFVLVTTGLIPGLLFSRHQALKLLKPDNVKSKTSFVRNALPISQFAISIALMICLFAMKKQNDMMLNQNTGFSKEQIMTVATNENIEKNAQTFKNELRRISGVSDMTFASDVIGSIGRNWTVSYTYKGKKAKMEFCQLAVTPNFFDFFGIKMLEGHTFSPNKKSYEEFVFNKKTIEKYGLDNVQEVKLHASDNTKIIAVAENFNFESAHLPIRPIGFSYVGDIGDKMYLKLNTHNLNETQNTLAQIEQLWDKLSPNLPLEYKFLDDSWNTLYHKEIQFQKVLNYAGIISLFIACLGLFGLSVFVAERRTKEIGIRKVNGATIGEILKLLNMAFVRWILIAFVIATPIAYYSMTKWLENFAYKTSLSWWLFALAGVAALGVALLTVTWQSYRAASRNPVAALRYE